MPWFILYLLLALALGLLGCQAAGIQTYPVTREQLDCARVCLDIPACPAGQTNIAGVVTSDAGAVVSVRCDVGKMLR